MAGSDIGDSALQSPINGAHGSNRCRALRRVPPPSLQSTTISLIIYTSTHLVIVGGSLMSAAPNTSASTPPTDRRPIRSRNPRWARQSVRPASRRVPQGGVRGRRPRKMRTVAMAMADRAAEGNVAAAAHLSIHARQAGQGGRAGSRRDRGLQARTESAVPTHIWARCCSVCRPRTFPRSPEFRSRCCRSSRHSRFPR